MQNFFSPLSDFFFWILEFLHSNLHVSWAWAIVILTVIVRVVLIPLTWRQIKSMRAMQALQPQLKALQEKYKDNKQVLNQKVMEFYSENHVSPFGSCLPLLLQMPVFLGLFYMLQAAGQPEGAGNAGGAFLDPVVGWLWIADITKFDYGLMFLYIASQFVASWQMARKGAGQQKIIAYVMPVMIGIFMYIYRWPAGLFIYWCTSNIWTIAQQLVLEKVVPAPVAVVSLDKDRSKQAKPGGKSPARTSGKAPAGTSGRVPGKTSGKAPAKTSARPPEKTSGKASGKSPGKPSPKTSEKTGQPAKQKTNPARPTGKAPAKPSGKSGGKTSGQKQRAQGEATSSKGQRSDSGTGGPKGAGGA
ncbi:MAG: membrane protein insertase YidC [Actinobacteria bacterium]|nr:membrane protein insertase YidC [Actinomycetota bacterium]